MATGALPSRLGGTRSVRLGDTGPTDTQESCGRAELTQTTNRTNPRLNWVTEAVKINKNRPSTTNHVCSSCVQNSRNTRFPVCLPNTQATPSPGTVTRRDWDLRVPPADEGGTRRLTLPPRTPRHCPSRWVQRPGTPLSDVHRGLCGPSGDGNTPRAMGRRLSR